MTQHSTQNFDTLFAQLHTVEVPHNLETTILEALVVREKRAAEIRLAFLGTISVASIFGIITSATYVSHAMATSGFISYLSLTFSDSSLLLTYWKEFALSLAETLPLVGVIGFFSAVGLFIWSTAKAATNGAQIFFARTIITS